MFDFDPSDPSLRCVGLFAFLGGPACNQELLIVAF